MTVAGDGETAASVNQADVEAVLESPGPNTVAATEDSVRDDNTAWSGLVWKDNERVFECCLRKQPH